MFDIDTVRTSIPALKAGIAHFDGPGGTQTPASVIDAMAEALAQPLSNRGTVTPGERNADQIVSGGASEARRAMADLLAAEESAIVFGRSATQLTYDFARTLARTWEPGDDVVVTRLDHDANIRPWQQMAAREGVTLRWADFDPETGELAVEHISDVLSERTRLVAVTAASNLIGSRPPIAAIARLVHQAGALLYVDGVHYAAHDAVDFAALGADFFVCSPYKFLGPHVGVLASRPALLDSLKPDKLLPSSDAVPERFELGTLPYELLAGTRAAVDYIADLSAKSPTTHRRRRLVAAMALIGKHEQVLRAQLDAGLLELGEAVTSHSRAQERTPTTLLTFADRDAQDAYRFLASRSVQAPAGSFYAVEASKRLGLGSAGGLRVGLSPYNDSSDVTRLLNGLHDFLRS